MRSSRSIQNSIFAKAYASSSSRLGGTREVERNLATPEPHDSVAELHTKRLQSVSNAWEHLFLFAPTG
jgi:hypothetical protein